MATPPGTKRIVFFGLPPIRELDLIEAIDVFATANQISGGKPLYDLKVVSAEIAKGGRIAGMFGVYLSCDGDYRSFKRDIDTLLVPGGLGVEEKKAPPAAIQWLKKAAKGSRRVGSICTGAFLLAQAGLLDGRRAATHWRFAAELGRRYPKVKVTDQLPARSPAKTWSYSWQALPLAGIATEEYGTWIRSQSRFGARKQRAPNRGGCGPNEGF